MNGYVTALILILAMAGLVAVDYYEQKALNEVGLVHCHIEKSITIWKKECEV